jgi:hypothetical protein
LNLFFKNLREKKKNREKWVFFPILKGL